MRFFAFHLMPYIGLDPAYDGPAWVTVPELALRPGGRPRALQPVSRRAGLRRRARLRRRLRQRAPPERLRHDAVAEPDRRRSSPAQTKRVKIAVIGNALPLYNPPTRVAEEFAMIDVISGGRLIAGMVVGGGPEYYSFSVNPTHARERFHEAHDLILKAWTEPGPFEWDRQALPLPLREPLAAAAAAAAPADLDSRRRQRSRRSSSSPSAATPTWASRTSTSTSSSAYFAHVPRGVRRPGYTADPLQMGWLRADLRRRDRRAGPRGVRGAPLVLREAAAARASRSSRRATRRRARSRAS